ncbi:hypothetical protein GGR92_001706 [Spirosoma lacussanchae]|uniref:hypothetical protein n=1 Tax=Spirosoma lacussanchae TaxID=1884249 RepID=UPI001109373F|nr:hypothetical protein [Spirosoma lacussanchae]
MKQQPDETLDQWVRQALDRLPDGPPPGSAFDPDRVWKQLRPAMQEKPVRWPWWRVGGAVAACLIGLLLVWLGLYPRPEPATGLARRTERQPAPPLAASVPDRPYSPAPEPVSVPHETAVAPDRIRKLPTPAVTPVQTTANPQLLETVAEPVANTNAPEAVATTTPALVASAGKPASTSAVVAKTRRFQVVHLNELQAEDEIRPAPHRTDRLVRLGTGAPGPVPVDAVTPTLTLPLNP